MSDQNTNGNEPNKEVHVDPDTCIGCMLCSQMCPNVYEVMPDGKSKATNPAGDTEENLQDSIDQCPVDAISWK